MKRFKIGFLALVAIAAMSFTVASHEGKLNTNKSTPKLIANCYDLQYVANPAENCTFVTPPCAASVVGKPVNNISLQPSAACGTGSNIFCCATLEIDDQQCDDQPQLSFTDYLGNSQTNQFAKVRAIFCRP